MMGVFGREVGAGTGQILKKNGKKEKDVIEERNRERYRDSNNIWSHFYDSV